jgi:hypothetical protein
MIPAANFPGLSFPFPIAVPVPVVSVKKSTTELIRTRVIDLSGNVIRVFDWNAKLNTLHFHIQNLPEGIYIIRPDKGDIQPIRWVVN